MMNPKELDVFLREAAMHPDELSWLSTAPAPQIQENEQVMTLSRNGTFRPGEMIAIHIHPTGDGPELIHGPEPIPHKHDFIEVAYLWDGDCQMEVEGASHEMKTGDFLILDTHSAHNPRIHPGCLLVNLAIETHFFNDVFFRQFQHDEPITRFFANAIYSQKSAKRYLLFQTDNEPRIRQLFTMLMQEYYSGEICSKNIVENLVIVLFSTMVRLQVQKSVNVTTMEQIDDDLVSQILRYISDNLMDVNREAVAEHFGYSYSYITTVLQTATGMSFSKLKNTLRIQKAELLLRTTDSPVTSIAHISGFSNITSFYEMFRKAYGMSPMEYRAAVVVSAEPDQEHQK